MSQILVSGSIAYDRIMDFPGLFKDHFIAEKLHNINVSFAVENFSENFGGTAGNIAYNLALLGESPCIVATAGSDIERYIEHLRTYRIDPESIQIDISGLTSSAFIITDKSDNQITAFAQGAGAKPYSPLPDIQDAKCAIVGADSVEDMIALPSLYREKGVPYFYDPGQQIPALSADDLRGGITGAKGLFANDYELELIMIKTRWDQEHMLEKCPALVVTLGEKGSQIVTRDGTDVVRAVAAAPEDPTGAGDAYRAGFLTAFVRGWSLQKAAQLASAVAAYCVEKYGTQNHTFTMPELVERYKATYGETLSL